MTQFKNILYPINLDSKNISPVINALEIAKFFKSRLHIVYVNDPEAGYRHPTDKEDTVALRVKEVVTAELLNSVDVKYAFAKGNLEEAIADYCKKNSIDLIITGHKHRNKLYSALFDTPDENIIDAIQLPVLIIPKEKI